MQRKFLTNLALLLFLNLLIKPFWILGIDRSVQNTVGDAYGFYFVIFNFSFMFNILLDMGITNFNNRNIAQNKQLLNKHLSGILIVKVLLLLVYVVVTYTVALIIGFEGEQLYLLGWICFNQFLLSFVLYLRSNISGLLLFKTDSFMSILDRMLMILFCSILLWGHLFEQPFQIEWYVYAQTLAYSLTFLIAFIIVSNKAGFKKLNWNWPFFVMIVKRSFPFATLVLLMTIYYRSDSIFIERLLPKEVGEVQTSIYAQAFRLLDAANMIPMLFAVLLLPIFSRMIKNNESVVQMVKLSYSLLLTLSVITAIGSTFYRFELMELLYLDNNYAASLIFGKIMFSFIAISSIYVFGSLLTANGNLRQLNIISVVALIVNFTLNIILVPKYLALGSAYANLATQFVAAVPQIILACVVFKFKLDIRYIASIFILILGVIIISYASKELQYNWYYGFTGMILLSLILASALKLLSIRGFIRIIREKE